MKKTIVLAMALIMGMAFAPMAEAAVNEANMEMAAPAKKKTTKKKTTKKTTTKTSTKSTKKTTTSTKTTTTAAPVAQTEPLKKTTETTKASSENNSGSRQPPRRYHLGCRRRCHRLRQRQFGTLRPVHDFQFRPRSHDGPHRRHMDLHGAGRGVLKQQRAAEYRWQGRLVRH
jgi:hypothetical protein